MKTSVIKYGSSLISSQKNRIISILNKIIKIYKKDGGAILLQKIFRHITYNLSPQPTVTSNSLPGPIWLLKYMYNFMFILKHGYGTDIMAEDWDTLILLDACRYDDFEEINQISGELTQKISKGVDSKEFIEKNFAGKQFHDTVYVTANPHFKMIDNNTFHEIISEPISKWNSEYQCVRPHKVTTAAVEAHRKYPNKRIIVHYMQPHDPPLGPTAEKLRKDAQINGPVSSQNENNGKRIMQLVAEGKISEKAAHKAYQETLEIVLDEVNSLLEDITGKIVISSDHGEMFGESPYPLLGNLYEHYQNPKTIELCGVPWLVVKTSSKRRKIISEDSISSSSVADDEIEKQLEALGYKN